jgi:hypothetical protein
MEAEKTHGSLLKAVRVSEDVCLEVHSEAGREFTNDGFKIASLT